MNISALLLLVGLMGAACSPVISCPEGCSNSTYTYQYVKLVSDLHNNSVAPWELKEDKVPGREPEIISYAHCMGCINDMIVKTIYVQIYIYQTVGVGDNQLWCRCPFELAVGCTCLKK
ncbi:unnamed protein product [Pleuronectes platessa]|uniref:Uncharacterized protein n=1 Tax=Pleuronectes platessa TaxID=8262 RepID=A0A9N7UQL3_PLEPL|nr:unnamed protein product [Pleuronectes platessa]